MVYSKRFAQCEMYGMKDRAGNGRARLVFHEDYDYYDNLLGGKSVTNCGQLGSHAHTIPT